MCRSIEIFEERLGRIEQAVIGHLANRLPHQNLLPVVDTGDRCDARKERSKRLYLWKLAGDDGHGLGDDPATVIQGYGGKMIFVGILHA